MQEILIQQQHIDNTDSLADGGYLAGTDGKLGAEDNGEENY